MLESKAKENEKCMRVSCPAKDGVVSYERYFQLSNHLQRYELPWFELVPPGVLYEFPWLLAPQGMVVSE